LLESKELLRLEHGGLTVLDLSRLRRFGDWEACRLPAKRLGQATRAAARKRRMIAFVPNKI